MSINLSDLSPRELDALIANAKKRKTTLKKRKPIATVRSKIAALAEAEGYSVADLFGGGRTARAVPRGLPRKGRKLGKVAPKYRNPANPLETWTGRGKQPRWLAAQVAQGKKADDFLIAANAGAKGGGATRTARGKVARKTRKAAGKQARKTATKAVKKAVKKASKKASKKVSKKASKKASKKKS